MEISVSERLLRQVALLPKGIDPRSLAPERCVVRLRPELVAAFEGVATRLRSRAGPGRTTVSEEWASALQSQTLGLLADALRGQDEVPLRPVPRYRLTLAALRMVEETTEERLTVRRLAEALGVTPRAVEYAFHCALGISPGRYLLSRRLNRVRRDLLASHDAT